MPLIVTPSQIQASADELNAEFLRVSADAESAEPALASAFASFADGWWSFYADLSGSYLEKLWGGTQEQIDTYRADLRKWQANLASNGTALTGPSVSAPAAGLDLTSILDSTKWILLAALAGVGVLIYLRTRSS